MRSFFLIIVSLVLAVTDARAQQVTPVLRYTPPSNAYRSAVAPPEDYALNGMNASVQVYPFRPFNGDIQSLFQTTLLRDWITPMHQEENVAAPPTYQNFSIPGAELALAASFVENIVGLPKPHFRMVIVAAGQAAIFDVSAGTAQSWQLAVPIANAMAASLQVEAGRAPPPLGQAAGGAIAGLYMGIRPKYMAGLMAAPPIIPTRSTSTSSRPTVASIATTTSSRCRAETLPGSISMPRKETTRPIPVATRSTATS
ncbi:MAG: hypothetical protein ACXWKQ_01615 [Reyranella sp.]